MSRIINIINRFIVFLQAKLIICFHYKKELFITGKHFKGRRYAPFTAPGWKWVVDDYLGCKRMRCNLAVPWPCSPRISVLFPENIYFHPDDINNFQGFGNYYQAIGKISIGHGTYIAPNVGIITSNHSAENPDMHDEPKPVIIGDHSWIGMNSMILPGVVLGEHTVVGAGSIVTHSFEEGNCIIAGNPARLIRYLNQQEDKQ